jgi:hypothetical protein
MSPSPINVDTQLILSPHISYQNDPNSPISNNSHVPQHLNDAHGSKGGSAELKKRNY